MFRFKTYLDKSTIPGAGLGVFAAEDIPAGAILWRMDKGFDLVINESDWPRGVPKDLLHVHGFSPDGGGVYILCLDNSRHTNHSRSPNCSYDREKEITLTTRAIRAGEEICEDYQSLEHPSRIAKMNFL